MLLFFAFSYTNSLLFPHLRISPSLSQKLLVSSLFYKISLLEHQYVIRMSDGAQAMGYNNQGLSLLLELL